MASPWNQFLGALKAKDRSFESIKGLTDESDIKEMIRACGITDIFDVAEIVTQFKEHQKVFTDAAKSISLHGLPPLGNQVGSPAGPSVPTGHRPATLVQGQFRPIPTVFSQGVAAGSIIWRLKKDRARWATEQDIAALVRHVLQDSISSAGLEDVLDCHAELSVFELRPDIWIVMTNLGIPVGVVEVKRPGDDDVVMNDATVFGQVYDYMMRLQSFHGLQCVFGIVSTYTSWRIFWFDDAKSNMYAGSQVMPTVVPALHPFVAADTADAATGPQGEILTVSPADQRKVVGSAIYNWNDATLPAVLASVVVKMRFAEIAPVSELSNIRPYIVLEQHTWYWKKVQWKSGAKLDRHNLPKSNCKHLVLLRDLRGGTDGRVWMACTTTGRVCVIKFARFLQTESTSDQATLEMARKRLQHEVDSYRRQKVPARLARFGDRDCLLMPHWNDIDFSALDDTAKQEIRDEVKIFATEYGLFHADLKPEHVVRESPTKPGAKSRVRFIDMVSVREIKQGEDVGDLTAKMLAKLDI